MDDTVNPEVVAFDARRRGLILAWHGALARITGTLTLAYKDGLPPEQLRDIASQLELTAQAMMDEAGRRRRAKRRL